MKNNFKFLLYSSANEDISVNALIKDETIWLNQKSMAELFDCSTDNISLHLKNIFADGELDKNSVTEKISATAMEKNLSTINKKRPLLVTVIQWMMFVWLYLLIFLFLLI